MIDDERGSLAIMNEHNGLRTTGTGDPVASSPGAAPSGGPRREFAGRTASAAGPMSRTTLWARLALVRPRALKAAPARSGRR